MSSKDPAAEEGSRRYRQAGLVYGVLGVAIMALTVATPELARPERRADLVHLLVGLPFFLLFALAVAYGDRPVAALARLLGAAPERARRLGAGCRQGLTLLLTLSALGRTLVFAANGVGVRPRLGRDPLRLSLEPMDAEPRMLVSAVLMAVICAFLARASWLPLLRRRP